MKNDANSFLKEMIPLDQVPALLPVKRSLVQIYAWASTGLQAPGQSERVVLRTLMIGRRKCTHEDWVWEFFCRTSGTPMEQATATVFTRPPSAAAKKKADKEATNQAKRLGIL